MQNRFLPWLFLLSLISTCAEVDISVPGFPQIAQFFNVSESVIQATITYNFLGYFLGALLYGPLSDSFGRRKMMLFGNAILSIGAVGCFYAPSIDFLLMSRFIQGIGASTSVVLVFTMIADLYQGEKAMKLIGMMNAALSIIMACAPLLGGVINQAIGWRGNYGTVAMFSVFVWVLLVFLLPESKTQLDRFNTKKMLGDYKQLLTSTQFITASMVPSLLFAAYMSYIVGSAFLYIETFGLTILTFVVHQAIIVASFAITSMYASKIIPLFGPNKTVKYGVALSFISILAFVVLSIEGISSAYWTTLLMSLFGIGFAACYPIIFSNSLSLFPVLQGPASSLIMGSRALLVSVSTAITGYLYNGQPLMLALSVFFGVIIASLFALSWLNENQPSEEVPA
ncbi:multidrug effflux MFS transporter [Legionella cincinnatiensis]|uniref:Major facilitator superfamily (MFS) transporter n=1 Tax=Legionella cincinnatiensis TaxID=28085 RepID=A0A378INW4_9GAMM|nr:multidrug effflux MFS transporter [Legionella cincinnatiensis]KTC85283.1 major facilitator superfamily (MFS) transporter [Legionella cincinnatiensis]STX36355.1 major facilitator superfamily (MFS) transporter [Legionella cincinnatiensis]